MKKLVYIAGRFYLMRKSTNTINYSPVHVSDGMSGKLKGIAAISTSCLLNTFCQARQKDPGSVCAHCYAEATLHQYSNLEKCLASNHYLLTESILPIELLPEFKKTVKEARLEAFSDIQNAVQMINYINIVRKNPHVTFTLWTKNLALVTAVLNEYGKPENLILIKSSEKLNKETTDYNGLCDHIFTVFAPAFIKKNEIPVNCGARSCKTCYRCYDRKNREFFINEKLK